MKRLQVEDHRKLGSKNGIRSVGVIPILMAAVVAVLISSTEAFPEVEIVVVSIHVVAGITKARILVGVRVSVIESPVVQMVGSSSTIPFVIAIVHAMA
jgi:hypothetical protein